MVTVTRAVAFATPQLCQFPHRKSERRDKSLAPSAALCRAPKGVQTMEQLVIAHKKLREAARLLAAANERSLPMRPKS